MEVISSLFTNTTTTIDLHHIDLQQVLKLALTTTLLVPIVLTLIPPSRMSRLLGLAKTRYYHSPKSTSLQLTLKDGGRGEKKVTFPDLVASVLPPCRLNPFIFNGHVQTLWTVLIKRSVPVWYKRWTFENVDPTYTGEFSVDFVVPPYQDHSVETGGGGGGGDGNGDKKGGRRLPPRTSYYSAREFEEIGSDDSRPMLVVLHGLSGGSHELYLRAVLAPLVAEEGGWEACVVNSRGCAGTRVTTNVLYNARATWDVRQTVRWLREKFPNRPLFGCGFSLGANIITNYIGEEGSSCVFKAAVVLSNPWNLEAGSLALQRTWMGLNVYSRAMGTSMKALFEKHVDQISQNPKIDVEAVRKLKYLHDFDRLVQGPTWGYPTEGAYYRDASSTDSLLGVRIPFLAINAEDDPIASAEALPYQEVQQTPYGVLCTTSLGGHLSWFKLGGGRWFADATVAFLQKMARDVDLSKIPAGDDSELNGQISRPEREPLKPVFDPLRRKLHILETKS